MNSEGGKYTKEEKKGDRGWQVERGEEQKGKLVHAMMVVNHISHNLLQRNIT